MAVPEWYSGTDRSGRVAAGIEAVIERMDARQAGPAELGSIDELLALEQEANWRAFLLGLKGTIYYDLEEIETARRILTESIAGYKVFLDTFDEVLSVYCQTCYSLGVILHDADEFADAAGYFLRSVPYLHEVYEEPYVSNVYGYLETCLAHTGATAFRVAFAEATAVARGGDCGALERLMAAYCSAGELERATEVFHVLAGACQDYEHFDRVLEFARANLGEPGVVN